MSVWVDGEWVWELKWERALLVDEVALLGALIVMLNVISI
jgi:hypothetical protein